MEARGGQRTSQPHLTSRSVPGLETSEPGRGCDEASQAGRGCSNPRPGVKGQSSKHSVLQSHQRNDDWRYNLGCLPLTTRPGNKKKGYRNPITEMSSEDIFDFCISMRSLHWQFIAILNPSSSHTQFAMVNIWGNLIKM